MLKTIFVHIGPPKTGTTSVQLTFAANAALLEAHDIFYYVGHPNHHAVARDMHKPFRRRAHRAVSDAFFAAAAASDRAVGVFSSELMVSLTSEEVPAAIDRFREVAESVKVLFYARHPLSHAVSASQQLVRGGTPLGKVEADPVARRVPRLLERWAAEVGRENMVVRPFERAQLAGGDVIDDVLCVLGRPELAALLDKRQSNESLSVLAVHLIDRLNRRAEEEGVRLRHKPVLSRIGGPRYVLPQTALDTVREKTAGDLEVLRRDWGVTLAEPDLVPTPPPLGEVELDTLADAFFELFRREAEAEAAAPAAGAAAEGGSLARLLRRVSGRETRAR